MYWTDEEERARGVQIPKDIVDLSFKLNCRELPIDHAQSLSSAIIAELPWLLDEEEAAIHQIHVAASGNGWIRPDDNEHDVLCLSHRTQFTLRIPTSRVSDAQALTGKVLNIEGNSLTLGHSRSRHLSKMTTLFSRYVVGPENEEEFLSEIAKILWTLHIPIRKLLCGMPHIVKSDAGDLQTKSVMMADLDLAESILLQRKGLGSNRLLGCGIIIPHKGIEAVKKPSDDPDSSKD